MTTFTRDWFTPKTPAWLVHVVPRIKAVQNPQWLEVGSYEGLSALWTLDNVLDPGSTVTCVDVFDDDFPGVEYWGSRGYAGRFDANIAGNPRIIKIQGWSHDCLLALQKNGSRFHGAYLDGDHQEHVVLRDLELLWPMLHDGSVLVCDDYGCESQPGAKLAIDKFLARPEIKHQVLYTDFQIILLKNKDAR